MNNRQCIQRLRMAAAGNPAQVMRSVLDEDEEMWACGKQVAIELTAKNFDRGLVPVG